MKAFFSNLFLSLLSFLAIVITGCDSQLPFEVRRISFSDTSDIFETSNAFVSDELCAILDSGKTVSVDWKVKDGFKYYDTTLDKDAFAATLSSYVQPCGYPDSKGEIVCTRRAEPLCKGRCRTHCGK